MTPARPGHYLREVRPAASLRYAQAARTVDAATRSATNGPRARIRGFMSTPQYIYVMKDLRKVVPPSREVLKGIWLSFFPGAKIGVVGPNGAGKSSLLRIMAGVDTEFQGEAWPAKGTRIGYLAQEPQLDASLDVKGNVELAVKPVRDLLREFDTINAKFAEPMSDDAMTALLDEQAKVQDRIDATGAWELDRKIEIAMDALRLPPGDADVNTLSGGERRRVALCRVLLEQPDMLLLDEPTNHLDAESVAWLERHLAEFPGTVVAITHDRYFLDNVAEWILELDRGEGIPWKGNYSSWLEQKQERLRKEEKQASARQRTLERELEWVRMAPRARHAKSKARISAYEELLGADTRERLDTAEIVIPAGPRLGDDVVTAIGLEKAYGEKLLFEDLNFRLPRGGIVGVIGPNGAGKTTLFRMIVGDEKPDAGELRVGSTVQLAYVDQFRDALDPEKTVWQEVSGGEDQLDFGKTRVNSRAYMSWFGFRGADQQKKVGLLSGGERNRLHLAKLLRAGGNVILLDEPTNDLDVDTLRALEEGILGFAGCVVVISHDRWFLDRIATHILAFEGDSRVVWFEGNYQEYEADRRRRLGAEADQPHRIHYRKLIRG
jgi:ATP-binding cassette ChvD family protein